MEKIEAQKKKSDVRGVVAKMLFVSAIGVCAFDIASTSYVEAKQQVVDVVDAGLHEKFRQLATRMGYEPKREPLTPKKAREKVISAAIKYGMNPDLALALWQVESRGDGYAVSPSGAIGHMQIMPVNAVRLCGYKKSAELFDEDKNIDCGVRYLAELLREYKWDTVKALKHYNGGGRCAVTHECAESEQYVKLVFAALAKNVVGES